MKNYIITDGAVSETASSLTDAAEICETWYDPMLSNGQLTSLPPADLDASSLSALNDSIAEWERQIAEKSGRKDLNLRVGIEQP